MKKFRIFLAAVLVSISLQGCGSRIELLHDIAESEGNEAMAALLTAGIASSKMPSKDGLVSIDVDQSQVARAIEILNAEGLPRERFAKMGDVFKKEGLISSPLEERARYIWALSQELSATLAQIDGVIKARVHVVLPEKIGGGDPSLPSSAAVFIKHKPGVILEDSITQIKRLVSNSIPGLSSDKVTVIILTSMVRVKKEASGQQSADLQITNQPIIRETQEIERNNKVDSGKKTVNKNVRLIISGIIGGAIVLSCGALAFVWWRRTQKRTPVTQPSD